MVGCIGELRWQLKDQDHQLILEQERRVVVVGLQDWMDLEVVKGIEEQPGNHLKKAVNDNFLFN